MKLVAQTRQLVTGARAVEVYMRTPSRDHAIEVRNIEREADAIRRALILQLNKSFITPIDREDLFGLSRALDDVLDYLYSTIREMHLLEVSPNEYLTTMAAIVRQCTQELYGAIQNIESDPSASSHHALRVLALENRMDTYFVSALADLFKDRVSSPGDVVQVLKLREIYEHMKHAVKSAEQAANFINDILVKFN